MGIVLFGIEILTRIQRAGSASIDNVPEYVLRIYKY